MAAQAQALTPPPSNEEAVVARAPTPVTAPVVRAPKWRNFHLFPLRIHLGHRSVPPPARDNPLSGAKAYASRAAIPAVMRPDIDIAQSDMATASVGYMSGAARPALPARELDGVASSLATQSDGAAGVSVKIPL